MTKAYCCVILDDGTNCHQDVAVTAFYGGSYENCSDLCADHVHYFAGVVSLDKHVRSVVTGDAS